MVHRMGLFLGDLGIVGVVLEEVASIRQVSEEPGRRGQMERIRLVVSLVQGRQGKSPLVLRP